MRLVEIYLNNGHKHGFQSTEERNEIEKYINDNLDKKYIEFHTKETSLKFNVSSIDAIVISEMRI